MINKIVLFGSSLLILSLLCLSIIGCDEPYTEQWPDDPPTYSDINLYVINEHTLFGLLDRSETTDDEIGEIRALMNNPVSGYQTVSSPILIYHDRGELTVASQRGLAVASTSGTLHAFDIPPMAINAGIQPGELLWETNLGGPVSATPFLHGSTICVGTNNGLFHFINAITGEIINTYTNPSGLGFNSEATYFLSNAIIVGSVDGHVYYFSFDGTFLQSFDTGAPVLAGAHALFNTNQQGVIVGNQSGELFKLNTEAEEVWKIQLDGSIYAKPMQQILVLDETPKLYVSTTQGTVYQVDGTTGFIDWEFQADGPIYSSVTNSTNGGIQYIYFTCVDGNVYALDKEGTLQWKLNLEDGPLYSTPAIDNFNQLYVNGISGVYGIDAINGNIISKFEVDHSPDADITGNFKSSILLIDDY